MNKNKIVGITSFKKNDKDFKILHCISVDAENSANHVGNRVETFFIPANLLTPDIVVGAVIRAFYNKSGYVSLVEVCK